MVIKERKDHCNYAQMWRVSVKIQRMLPSGDFYSMLLAGMLEVLQ